MWKKLCSSGRVAIAAMLVGLLGIAGSLQAAEYWLRADATQLTMPDGQIVPMWGYALDADNDFTTIDGTVQIPGPELTVPPGESLTIHLKNNLPEPSSIVIPGQIADTMTPARFTDGPLAGRIRSFTAEAAANGGEQTYTWTAAPFKSGTFLYQSGSHPGIQVPMGLYGAVKADAAVGQAYPGVAYDSTVTLLFSEIDPDQHAAVAGGTYGTADYPGTLVVGYQPKYFLINGQTYSAAAPPAPLAVTGTTLLRFLNAGLRGRMPTVQGNYWRLIAEDGNPKPFVAQQYSIDLQAGMTMDTLLQPAASGPIAIFDRALGVGMYAFLDASTGVTLQQPNGGETLYSGTTYTIRWTAIPPAAGYDLHYSLDNGATWTLISQIATGGANLFDWTVPAVATTQTASLVRVAALDQTGTAISVDQSDAVFTIVPTSVQVLAPNGGETLVSGTTATIQWNGDPAAAGYMLDYSLDNGATWTAIQQVGAVTSYSWEVPVVTTEQTGSLVRVSALNAVGGTISVDPSDAVFAIAPSPVQLTSPNGGETLTSGTTFNLQWTSSPGAAAYQLHYSTNNGGAWTLIQQVGVVTSFNWTVPTVTTPQTASLVRVTALSSSGATLSVDQSNAPFTIVPAGLRVLTPNGGETLISGTIYSISWTAMPGAASYRMFYSVNNGVNWTHIQQVGPTVTSYNWPVRPFTTPQTQSLMRVRAYDAAGVQIASDNSDAVFTIAPAPPASLSVLTPNGGETLISGTLYGISWTPMPGAASYRMFYSVNNGANWTHIQQVGPTVTSYNWPVRSFTTPQTACLMRVRAYDAAGNQLATDNSDATFTIAPVTPAALQVLTPNGGETLIGGTQFTIRWNPHPGAASYRMFYSVNTGASWTHIQQVGGTVTSYNWPVRTFTTPQTASLMRVRAYDAAGNQLATDISDTTFTIAPAAITAAQTLKTKK